MPDEQPVISTALGSPWPISTDSCPTRVRRRCEPSRSRRPARSGSTRSPIRSSQSPGDAIVRVDASGVCGSDLHIYHGRVAIEPGFTIGHEYVGEVVAAGDGVSPSPLATACWAPIARRATSASSARRGDFHKCDRGRVFGHGKLLGELQGAQAELLLVPTADLTLRKVPERDVGRRRAVRRRRDGHRLPRGRRDRGRAKGDAVAVLGLGPVGLCAVQAALAAGAGKVIAVDTVADRLEMARVIRRRARSPHRGRPQGGGQGGDRGTRRRRHDRRGRASRCLRPRLPADPQVRHGLRHRRLRRADGGAHGNRLDQGADREDRPRERDQARGPGARRR